MCNHATDVLMHATSHSCFSELASTVVQCWSVPVSSQVVHHPHLFELSPAVALFFPTPVVHHVSIVLVIGQDHAAPVVCHATSIIHPDHVVLIFTIRSTILPPILIPTPLLFLFSIMLVPSTSITAETQFSSVQVKHLKLISTCHESHKCHLNAGHTTEKQVGIAVLEMKGRAKEQETHMQLRDAEAKLYHAVEKPQFDETQKINWL